MQKEKAIEVKRIRMAEHEQRISEDDEDFASLVHSIGEVGLINALVVKPDGDNYTVVAGHRRLAAIRKLGYQHARCQVKDPEKQKDAAITFAENFCRRALTPLEQAGAIKDCYDQGIMSVEQMASAFHRSENWIAAQMAMVSWPADVLEAIHKKQISVAAASSLAMVDEENYRGFLVRNAVEGGATARTTAAWLQAWRANMPAMQAIEVEAVPEGQRIAPMVPQAPCLGCGTCFRTDQLSHVPMCQTCIQAIRNAGSQF